MQNDVILDFQNVDKHFPGVHALKHASFQVKQGTVHGLCGENGAGKSTLMKILSGVYPVTEYTGDIYFDGKLLNLKENTIHRAKELGIGIVYQELALVPQMTVGENIYLGKEAVRRTGINWEKLYADTAAVFAEYSLDIDPQAKISSLSVGKQQLVEIAKAIADNTKLLILDEPTSALSEQEIEILMHTIEKLKNNGITCIYITHKLEEIFRITDSVTILRDGAVVISQPTSKYTNETLISHMVGREMTERFPHRAPKIGEIILEVSGFTVQDPYNLHKKSSYDISFSVRKGEIFGIAGLMGSGRTELVRALFGEYGTKLSGTIQVHGKTTNIKSARDAMKAGIFLVPEDRKNEGLILKQTIIKNISLPSLDFFASFFRINKYKEATTAEEYAKKLSVKAPNLYVNANTLSGGNQQKVVLAKALLSGPKILILDDPTRGIDVGAKYEIYKQMVSLTQEGVSIIMISSSLEEVLGMSDRILVLSEGRTTAILDSEEADQETIMHHAVGAS